MRANFPIKNFWFLLLILLFQQSTFAQSYQMIPMVDSALEYDQEELVTYFDQTQRERYLITIKDKLLYDAHGKLFDTGSNKGIFVMDEFGNIYASAFSDNGKFHHSSFLSGAPVSGAGRVIVNQGELRFLDNHSGHYDLHPVFIIKC